MSSLQYLANGDAALPKERIEVFAGGAVAIVDDFRLLELVAGGKRRTRKTRKRAKGHEEELRAFVDAVAGRSASVQPPDSVFWSSALTLQVPVALGLGRPVAVDLPDALGGAGAAAASPVWPADDVLERSPDPVEQ